MMSCASPVPLSSLNRDALIVSEIPHAKYIAHRIHAICDRRYPLEDLEQEAMIGVMKALEHFDLNRGVTFKVFSDKWIWGTVWDYIRNSTNYNRRSKEPRIIVGEDELREVPTLPTVQKQFELTELIGKTGLSDRQREVIVLKLEGYGVRAIAEKMGYSQPLIWLLQAQAIKKMKAMAGV